MNWYIEVLKKYAIFKGRAGRKEFWIFSLISFIITVVLMNIDFAINSVISSNIDSMEAFIQVILSMFIPSMLGAGFVVFLPFYSLAMLINTVGSVIILYPLYSLAILIPALAVTVRRLHDIGHSGWWILIGCIFSAGGIMDNIIDYSPPSKSIWINTILFMGIVGIVVLLTLCARSSQPGANQYGASPKKISESETTEAEV